MSLGKVSIKAPKTRIQCQKEKCVRERIQAKARRIALISILFEGTFNFLNFYHLWISLKLSSSFNWALLLEADWKCPSLSSLSWCSMNSSGCKCANDWPLSNWKVLFRDISSPVAISMTSNILLKMLTPNHQKKNRERERGMQRTLLRHHQLGLVGAHIYAL